MAFQKKYYFQFSDISKNKYICELWQNTETTLTATEIKGGESPFSVSYPEITNKFEPVRGSGASINLLSETNLQFLGMYTADMQEYQVRFYQSGTTNTLKWCGYLDSEIYSEPLSYENNYPVSFSANDGFALLDRMYYLNPDGSQITGITSQFEIIKFILNKINLPFPTLSVYLSTSVSGATTTQGQTALNVSYCVNSNFYNEDNESETLRNILENILKIYGAFIIQSNGNLYITDVNQLATGSLFQMERYDLQNNFNYLDDTGIDANLGDLTNIKFASTDSTLDIVSGVNKEIIKYSPYKQTELINFDATDDNFQYVTTAYTYGITGFRWSETYYNSGNTFDRTPLRGFFCKLNGINETNNTEEEYYLRNITEIDNAYNGTNGVFDEGPQTFEYKGKLTTLINSSNDYAIKIEMQVYPNTKNDLNNPDEIGIEVGFINLFCDLIIGDKKYNWHVPAYQSTVTNGWKELNEYGHLDLPFYNRITNLAPFGNIADTWTAISQQKVIYTSPQDYIIKNYDFLIPLETGTYGDVNFKIYGYTAYNTLFGDVTSNFFDLRIKDIKLTIVDSKGNEVNESDTEYVGYMDKNYKNEGQNISTILGTNFNDFPVERGGILGFDNGYYFIKYWTRNGITDIIENLLLRSYVGNYQGKTLKLSCVTNKVTGVIGYITYMNYLNDYNSITHNYDAKKFMISGCNIDYSESTTELTLQEIFTDSLTIKKSF